MTLSREPELGVYPIRMRMMARDEEIAPESRVNYSTLVTVNYNVKVFFIGHIVPEDVAVISEAVDQSWLARMRRRKHR